MQNESLHDEAYAVKVGRYLGPRILHENASLNPLYLEQKHVQRRKYPE